MIRIILQNHPAQTSKSSNWIEAEIKNPIISMTNGKGFQKIRNVQIWYDNINAIPVGNAGTLNILGSNDQKGYAIVKQLVITNVSNKTNCDYEIIDFGFKYYKVEWTVSLANQGELNVNFNYELEI